MTRVKALRSSSGHGLSRSTSAEDGFTLAEVVVSIALFMVIMVATTNALINVVKTTRFSRDRVQASNVARQTIERLRAENNTSHTLDIGSLPTQVEYGTTFTARVCMMTDSVSTTLSCNAVPTCLTGHYWNVSVNVTWNQSGTRNVKYDTVLAC